MNWFEEQYEWLKGFFDEDDHRIDSKGHNPSHKNLIGIAMVVIFAIAYLKTIATTVASVDGLTDIPSGWQIVILGVLGIRAAQAGYSSYVKSKNGNGNGSENGLEKPPA